MNIKMNIKQSINQYKTQITSEITKLNRNTKIGIMAGVIGCIVLSTVFVIASGSDVYSLTIAGKDAGYITDKALIDEALEEIKTDYASEDGIQIAIDEEGIACKRTDFEKNEISAMTVKELEKKILSSKICTAKGWTVSIDGKNIVAVNSKDEAKQILTSVKNHYLTDGSKVISADFKENVIVTQSSIKLADIMKPDDAVTLILTGAKAPKIYTVKDGDTIWDIASANGISTQELQTANPGFDPNKLKIGQQLNLIVLKPYVTVQTKEQIASTEKIDFQTVYETTSSLNKGETKIKTAGVYGSQEVKSEVTKENGVVIASTVLESVVTAQPQTQIALQGTKATTKYVASRGGGRSVSVDASGSDIVAYAKEFIGTPYSYGGTSPDGFDCSGFTRYVYSNFGASLPHNSASQYSYGTSVSKSELAAGDLVFFSSSKGISHVGIYVGGGKFIHSPQSGDSVKISSFSSSSLKYSGAVRIAN